MTNQNAPSYPGGHYAFIAPEPPATITAARIIGWIQGGLAAVATAIVVIITIVAANAVSKVDSDTDAEFHNLGNDAVGILVIGVIVCAALTAAIIVPLTRLKPGHLSAGTGLVVVEAVFLVLDLLSLAGSGSKWVSVVAALMSIAMIALLCSASSRSWLRTGRSTAGVAGSFPAMGYQNPSVAVDRGAAPGYQQAPSGQWVADPYGRHELRMYDGSQWTHWVSDYGTVSADPVS